MEKVYKIGQKVTFVNGLIPSCGYIVKIAYDPKNKKDADRWFEDEVRYTIRVFDEDYYRGYNDFYRFADEIY